MGPQGNKEQTMERLKFWISGEVTGRAYLTDSIDAVTIADPVTGDESISDDYIEIEGTARDVLAIAASTRKQPGSVWAIQASREMFCHLVDSGEIADSLVLTPAEMERLDDGQGWWAAGDRVTLGFCNGPTMGLSVEFLSDCRPDDPRRADRQQIEAGDEDGYGWEPWGSAFDYEWILDRLAEGGAA